MSLKNEKKANRIKRQRKYNNRKHTKTEEQENQNNNLKPNPNHQFPNLIVL